MKGGNTMTPGEELMLLLELNGFDVVKFKLKKQLEYEESGNENLYKNKSLRDLIAAHYTYEEVQDYLHRNPLRYRPYWGEDITSIDQFYVSHPDLEEGTTLGDFLQDEQFNDIQKESILYDILDGWVEEYRESSIVRMENLRELINRLPKKNRKYKKPSLLAVFLTLLLALTGMFLYKSPTTLQLPIIPFIGNFVDAYVTLLYDVWWFALLGNVAIYALLIYAITNIFFRRYMKDIKSEKSKHAQKAFDKWDRDMKDIRLQQAGYLEDYVDQVIQDPSHSTLAITSLMKPELLMDKFKAYVMMIERKYDVMTKYYRTYRKVLRWWFVLSVLLYITFYVVGIGILRGWFGV